MKAFLNIVLGGIVGGAFVFALFWWMLPVDRWEAEQAAMASAAKVQQKVSKDWVTPNDERPLSFAEAAHKATPVVVHIRAEESAERAEARRRNRRGFTFEEFFGGGLSPFYRREGSGSGVIFSNDGYIVTNYHVVEFADIVEITLSDGRKFRANKIGAAPDADIAVLKIEASDLPTIEWADSEQAEVGDWVLAIGNPFDYLTSTVTAGIISAKGRDLEIAVDRGKQKFTNFIQTDAAVNPGNSGGALVDADGKLLGINSAIATPTGVYAGYSFAIPVEAVRTIVEEILTRATNGSLGFEVTALDRILADELQLSTDEGILILNTEAGSAAQYAGLRPFDIITAVDGRTVSTIEQLEELLSESKVGQIFELTVIRKQKEFKVPIRLKQ